MSLNAGAAERQPTLACVGYVESVGALKTPDTSAGKIYYSVPLQLKNHGTYNGKAGKDQKVSLVFLPEYFDSAFDVDKVSESTHGERWRGVRFVFEKNIISGGSIRRDGTVDSIKCAAALQCMAGTQDLWGRLTAAVDALPDTRPDTVYTLIHDFLTGDAQGELFGYVLRQPFDRDGLPKSDFQEVDRFFRLNDKVVSSIVKRAAGNDAVRAKDPSAERYLLRFDPTDYEIVPEKATAVAA